MNRRIGRIIVAVAITFAAIGAAAQPPRGMEGMRQADADGDGRVSFDEATAQFPGLVRERFDRLDTDKDGFISAKDRPADGARTGQPDARRLFAADSDRDGAVTLAEFSTAFPQAPDGAFARLDRNGDGKIDKGDRPEDLAANQNKDRKLSLEQAEAVMPRMNAELFARLDRDGDGFLSGQELEAARRRANREDTGGVGDESRGHVSYLIQKADRDGDKALTYEELTAAKPGYPRSNFDGLDTNKDGKVTAGE